VNYPSGFSQLTPARRPSWLLAHCLEFLGPSTANRLTDKQVTLGVHCDRMQERELASHVTERPKPDNVWPLSRSRVQTTSSWSSYSATNVSSGPWLANLCFFYLISVLD
jgi:hypothetical protein